MPRRELYFNNSTKASATFSNTTSASATADSEVVTSTESVSTLVEYDVSTIQSRITPFSVSRSNTPQLAVTLGIKPSGTRSLVSVSDVSQNTSETVPILSSSTVLLSTRLGTQQHESKSTVSAALSTTSIQYVALPASGYGVAYPITPASPQQSHTNAPTETKNALSISTAIPSTILPISSSGVYITNASTATSQTISADGQEIDTASPSTPISHGTSLNLDTTTSLISTLPPTTTGLLLHSVSSLTVCYPIPSADSTNGRVSSSFAVTTTPTRMNSEQTVPASENPPSFSTSPTATLSNTSTAYSTTGISPGSSMAYTTVLPPISSWSGTPTSSIDVSYPTVTESASSTITGTGTGTQPDGSYVALLPGYGSTSSETHPTPTWNTEGVSSMTRSDTPLQTTQTTAQYPSTSGKFMQTSTSVSTRETSDARLVSSSISTQPIATSEIYITLPTSLLFQASKIPPMGYTTTRESSSCTSTLGASHTHHPSSLRLSSSPAALSTSRAMSGFVTKIKTQFSEIPAQTKSVLDAAQATAKSSPTQTAAAAPPPLTVSETAGVALGSTAGVLLAIVAAIFVVRRYHARRAATSAGSSGAYPEIAYLYDASILRPRSSSSEDGEASAFMSGGAGGIARTSTESRLPPRAPHNSFDYGYRHLHSVDGMRYSDPGNPFSDTIDPFLDWRSSVAINAPTDTVSALAAAVVGYSNGPQKPLPALPETASRQAFRNHVIPSPTLSPLMNACSLRRSPARSSSRSSVKSQRSLRKLHSCTGQNPASSNYSPSTHGRGLRQSLASIRETDNSEPFSDPIEHDLLLPVDVRTETPDSVVVYAPTPISRKAMRPFGPPVLPSQNSMTMPINIDAQPAKSKRLRSTGSLLFPKNEETAYKYSSLAHDTQPSLYSTDHSSTDDITHNDFPSPPSASSTPVYKGWDDIKRHSSSSSPRPPAFSPPPPPFHAFGPPHANPSSPPRPLLKKRSLIHPLMSQNPFFPLTPKPQFTHASPSTSSQSFDGPRRSLLAKVQSIGEMREEGDAGVESGMEKRVRRESSVVMGLGLGLGYRDSVSRKKEMAARWGPDEVGRMV